MMRVFLTGATGVIGSALVPLWLESPSTSVALLMRRKHGAGVRERLADLGRFWGLSQDDVRWSQIEIVEGDAAIPRFGLDESLFHSLGRSVTHIVHCAGAVKMTLPIEQARAHAVVPARAAMELAELCRGSGQLQKVEIISTVGVGGRTSGQIPERPMPDVKRFHNTYEEAKAEAERIVLERWSELPVTIHRPSMVVGDSRTGRIIHFQVFYHLCEFLSGKRTSGFMPKLADAALDLVPVDYVASAIHWSASNPATGGRVLHLSSGPDQAVRLPQLVDMIRSRASTEGASLPRLRYLSLSVFRHVVPVLGFFAGDAVKRALGNLDLFLAYLEEQQSFGSTETQRLLSQAGIVLPHPTQYLDVVLDYYQQLIRGVAVR
jgi:thioester reductase-like protein